MANRPAQQLKALWDAWKRVARRIANFQARVLLTLLYVIAILPFGLAVRLFSDPLRIKRRPTKWMEHPPEVHDLTWARRQ